MKRDILLVSALRFIKVSVKAGSAALFGGGRGNEKKEASSVAKLKAESELTL
jgi:hypothetical protein